MARWEFEEVDPGVYVILRDDVPVSVETSPDAVRDEALRLIGEIRG